MPKRDPHRDWLLGMGLIYTVLCIAVVLKAVLS